MQLFMQAFYSLSGKQSCVYNFPVFYNKSFSGKNVMLDLEILLKRTLWILNFYFVNVNNVQLDCALLSLFGPQYNSINNKNNYFKILFKFAEFLKMYSKIQLWLPEMYH